MTHVAPPPPVIWQAMYMRTSSFRPEGMHVKHLESSDNVFGSVVTLASWQKA